MKSFLKKLRRRAFTTAELLMAAGISGVIGSAVMVSYVGLQRLHTACLTRSEMRTNVIRVFDFLEADLRDATALTGTTSGGYSTFPLTLTVPQRYSTYETSGPFAGDPSRTGSRLEPTVNTTNGRLGFGGNVTITYKTVANGTAAVDVQRSITWTSSGAQQTATRTISTLPKNSTFLFRSGGSTSGSPTPITATDYTIYAQISAPFTSAKYGNLSPTKMETPILLRGKTLK